MALEEIIGKPVKKRMSTSRSERLSKIETHDGYNLTHHELLFIENYIKTGSSKRAAEEAGCPGKGGMMLSKDYIRNEISYRIEELHNDAVADRMEIMNYFTRVMRGEVKDQFGLDAPLSERTAAAKELAKRIIDIPNDNDAKNAAGQIKLTIDWKRH